MKDRKNVSPFPTLVEFDHVKQNHEEKDLTISDVTKPVHNFQAKKQIFDKPKQGIIHLSV